MSIQAVGWALDQDLPARPKLVLVAIANHANHVNGYCWLKAETIAAEAACTPRSVYRFVGGLVRNGYLRKAPKKGDDGKQRANDYWILFNREEAAWDWGAELGEDRGTGEPDDGPETGPQETDDSEISVSDGTPDVVQPHDTASHGTDGPPTDSGVTRQDENKHALSCGPTDSRVSRKNIAEPSKTNLKSGGLEKSTPRRYAAPPPEQPPPLGATTPTGQFFVFEGTRAYEAWAAVKAKENRLTRWTLAVSHQGRRGWWFPTLFPPGEKPPPENQPEQIDPPYSKTG